MNEQEKCVGETPEISASNKGRGAPDRKADAVRRESRFWWMKLLIQPLLLIAAGAGLLAGLGVAQRFGWISAEGQPVTQVALSGDEATRYICPMMCTPPQAEPGRCPVCGMELVPTSAGGGQKDAHSVQISPAARRLANIETVAVKSAPVEHTIRAVGKLSYDEGSLKSISAYVDGRLDRLYADYTGVVVKKGDHLALLYSPLLYSTQVEFLLSKKAVDKSQSATLQRVIDSNRDLYRSARQRLIELGMTEEQIEQLEQAGDANSRIHLCAPISGTVIEKLAVEGQYVKEGQAIYHLADLSTVWLMLELFPEDVAALREGQTVEAEVHSLPGQKFSGRVTFIDPTVDPKKRTVGVRVVIPNREGLLRVGDFAKATIHTPAAADSLALTVPRSAVLMNGGHSLVYAETEPGRFELRHVTLGASCGDQVVVLDGLHEGEQVATSGNFLIDSQMQLVGNPSLINPMKAEMNRGINAAMDSSPAALPEMDLPPIGEMELVSPASDEEHSNGQQADQSEQDDIEAALSQLPPEDRQLAESQRICPVSEMPLGSMGAPIKVIVQGRTVFICCEGCRESLLAEPTKYLARLGQEAVK